MTPAIIAADTAYQSAFRRYHTTKSHKALLSMQSAFMGLLAAERAAGLFPEKGK